MSDVSTTLSEPRCELAQRGSAGVLKVGSIDSRTSSARAVMAYCAINGPRLLKQVVEGTGKQAFSKLPPGLQFSYIELMLAYGFGKPRQTVEQSGEVVVRVRMDV